jgi:hypothetical protein
LAGLPEWIGDAPIPQHVFSGFQQATFEHEFVSDSAHFSLAEGVQNSQGSGDFSAYGNGDGFPAGLFGAWHNASMTLQRYRKPTL